VQNLFIGHVEDNKCIRKDAISLHAQALHSCPGKTGKDETLFLFLDAFYLLFHHFCNNLILYNCVVLEIGFD